VRKAKGIYLPQSGNILKFCSNLLLHALSDIKHCSSERLEYQHPKLNLRFLVKA